MSTSDHSNYSAVPTSSSSPPRNVAPSTSRQSPISLYSFILLSLFLVRIIFAIFGATSPFLGLLFIIIALTPTAIFARLILRVFHDPVVSPRFLLSQFLTAAIPLLLLVFPFEIFFAVISTLPLFAFADQDNLKDFGNLLQSSANADSEQMQKLNQDLLAKLPSLFPLPVIILAAILVAFLSAGLVEEVGKWLVSRRYKDIDIDARLHHTRRISVSGIFACACMSALGFATMENIGYSAMAELSIVKQNALLVAFFALVRGFVAYTLHIATQLHIAVAAAQRLFFADGMSVRMALLHAILVHGVFDGVAFVAIILTALGKIQTWVLFVVPVFDVVTVLLFGMLVRARYCALLERERVVSPSEPESYSGAALV